MAASYSPVLSDIQRGFSGNRPHSGFHSGQKRLFLIKCLAVSCFLILMLCISGMLIAKASEGTPATGQYKYYTSITVHENDTLWALAAEYGSNAHSRAAFIQEIKQLNNMTSDTLYSGQQLLIYYYSDVIK